MAKAKIFISSVNEDGLKPLRKAAFRELQELGHEPLMWEENLGPWPAHVSPVVKCLEAVEESDLFLLFIGNYGGTFDKDAQRTVTHMEFIKAHNAEKTILVFVDSVVKAMFFRSAKGAIDQFVEHYFSETGESPDPERIVAALAANADIPKSVDPYVWYLLHDMLGRQVYMDDLALGVHIDWRTYFSDLLRRGSMLLPLGDSISGNARRLEQFETTFGLMTELLPFVRPGSGGLRETGTAFLKAITEKMPGGRIEQHYGTYMSEVIGLYQKCSAATLYIREDEKMRFVAKYGDVTWSSSFRLDDQTSYIVLTHNMNRDAVHYKQAKQMFYCCFKSGDYVLSLHFAAPASWTNRTHIHYQSSVNDAIISNNAYLVQLVRLLLEGAQP